MAESTGAAWQLMALLGEGASFEGKLVFEGRVRIDGNFRGEISSEGTLVIGDRATVEASISVGSLIVLGGTVRGDVRAQHTVELHAPAKVFGNITAPQLAIDRGVVFEGQSRVAENDDAPTSLSPDAATTVGTPGSLPNLPTAIVTPDE